MKDQRILTLALISIERLIKKQRFYQEMYGEQSITLTMELLFRCIYQKDKEIQVDQRYHILIVLVVKYLQNISIKKIC